MRMFASIFLDINLVNVTIIMDSIRDATDNVLHPEALQNESDDNLLLWLQREYSKLMKRELLVRHRECVAAAQRVPSSNSSRWGDRAEEDEA